MLRVKKQIPFKINSYNEKEYLENQNHIKNSLKNLYIGNKNKQKTIDDYAQLVTQVREEYAKLQNKCLHLEETLQKYRAYVDGKQNRHYRNWHPPERKRKRKENERFHQEERRLLMMMMIIMIMILILTMMMTVSIIWKKKIKT